MIGHDLHLNDCVVVFGLLLKNQFSNSVGDGSNQHLAPILRAEDDMVFAAIHDSSITMQSVRCHAGILFQNARSVNPARSKAPDRQTLAPCRRHAQHIPPLKQVGFTGRIIIGVGNIPFQTWYPGSNIIMLASPHRRHNPYRAHCESTPCPLGIGPAFFAAC